MKINYIDRIPQRILKGAFRKIDQRLLIRVITEAIKLWQLPNQSNIIFNRTYRIAGSPKNVASVLRDAGISEDEIKTTLENSITYVNYYNPLTKEYNQEYLKEIALFRKMKELYNSVEVVDKAYNNILKVIKVGELWIVKYFLQLYPKIDLRNFNNKAYHVAIESGNQEITNIISCIIIERDWLEKQAFNNQIKELDEESNLPLTLYQYCRRCL